MILLFNIRIASVIKEIMTTIVNFIEGNFIANPQEKDVEKPFWVLDSSDLEISHRAIVQSLLAKCKQDKKYQQLYIGLWCIWILGFLHWLASRDSHSK